MLRLEVGPVAHGGHCVARHEGRVVFVRHAIPGELVVARVTAGGEKASYWRADAVEILRPSPDRVTPPCPLAGPGRCGGCDWQHVDLAAQRRLKAAVVTEHLERQLGTVGSGLAELGLPPVTVDPVPGDADGLGWRTRVRFAVDAAGRAGLHPHRSHDVIPVERCPIADPRMADLGVGQARWRGVGGVEVAVPGGDDDPLLVLETAAGGRGRVAPPRLTGPASVAARPAAGRGATREELTRVRGRTWLTETVTLDGAERPFRVTGAGFWQVHPGMAQLLLDTVLAAAGPRPGERAVDLYSGVGLFAAGLAARVGERGRVVAVESDGRAASDARRSLHDLAQVRFVPGRVERVLPKLAEPGGEFADGVDVAVLDPPRSGAGAAVVRALAGLRPRVIVYVACDPAALARDVATAADAGYRLSGLQAFDAFPMTHHVECVATFVPA
jgi:tRNA/tmRNA/rRNA uracil-C5-methylase (TrmA/RlmC/RlmD family)